MISEIAERTRQSKDVTSKHIGIGLSSGAAGDSVGGMFPILQIRPDNCNRIRRLRGRL